MRFSRVGASYGFRLIALFLFLALFFGIWLLLGLSSKLSEMDSRLRIEIGSNWKEVRLDKFAIDCGIHVAFAKWYLNSKARQLNGLCEANDLGDIVYLFGDAKQKFLQEHLPYMEDKK